jgi:hypothetical protein
MFKFGRGIVHEIDLGLVSVNVTVGLRRMRAGWTREMAQDIRAFHNLDAEAELIRLLSENMAREIDREIIREIRGLGKITSFKFGR